MNAFERGLTAKFEASSSQNNINNVADQYVIDIENEDEDFQAEYNRVISNDEIVPHADNLKEKFWKYDPYVNMEIQPSKRRPRNTCASTSKA